MDGGYFLFYSSTNTEKYLGFNRNGKPFNYTSLRFDKQCRKIFKKKFPDSSADQSPASVDYEQTTSKRPATSHNHRRHKSSSTRTHQRSNSNKIEPTKVRSTPSHSSTRRHKVHTKTPPAAPTHAHRHHHNIHHRYNHTTSNKVIDSYDNTISAERLGNEDLNALYSHNDSSVNIEKPRQTTTAATLIRHHHRKTTPSVADDEREDFSLTAPNVKDNELSQSNCTNSTGNCLVETLLRDRKGGKARKKLDEELTTRRHKKTSETTARKSSRKSHKIERENT
jgi:hypothetical protein